MHIINKNAIVPYSAKQMFELVNNIKDYPNFLKWCSDSSILEQNSEQIIASIKVSKSIFNQEFTTINNLVTDKKISIKLQKGPFKHLNGGWIFTELRADACKVDFNLSFEFASKLMDISLSSAFENIVKSQLNSFIQRAKEVYA